MTLRLNNKEIRGKEIEVNIKMPFGDADLSGTGNGTDAAEEGTKAKEMTVNLLIPYDEPDWLTELVTLAESTESDGSRTIYRIGDDAALAMKFYQAKFVGEVNTSTQKDIRAWRVNFSMKEKLSVPERQEQRNTLPPAQQQTQGENTDQAIESHDIPPQTQLSSLERVFQYMDEQLGSVMNTPPEGKE